MTLEAIIESFSEALRRGTTPSIPDLIAQHPEHADALTRLLPTLLTLEDFAQDTSGIPSEMELPLPMMLGNEFRLERKIGYGGMGTVFEAVQIPLERRCAIKVLARHLAANPTHRKAFIQEARLMGNLHHPHIVKVISAGETSEYAYYAMELIPGALSLDQLQEVSSRQLAQFALQAAQALAYIHHCHLTHCDIKPSNFLINAGDHLLLSDFGLARTPEQETVITDGGTRAYAAPEARTSPLADQYAFGKTFQDCSKNLPPDLAAIFKTCTHRDPLRRYRSMDAVAEDLRHHLAGEPVSVRPTPLLRRLWLWSKRKPMAASLAGCLFFGAILAVSLLTNSHNRTRKALATSEENLTMADTALACTFEYVSQNDPSRHGAILLDALIPYYRDVIERRDRSNERIATAERTIGTVSLRTGDYSTAIAAFQREVEAYPSLQAQNRLVEALLAAEQTEKGQALALEIVAYLKSTDPALLLEAIRACTYLSEENATPYLQPALNAVQQLLNEQPEHADLRHLYYTLLERLADACPPELNLDTARLSLASADAATPRYGIAALNRMTQRLNQNQPLTQVDSQNIHQARTLAKRLLGKWQDDPQVLLSVVRFTVADNHANHRTPRQNQTAFQQNERLMGALEVLSFGSSLPEDTKTPLFETLFTQLLDARRLSHNEKTERLRRHIRSRRPFPKPNRTKPTAPPNSI